MCCSTIGCPGCSGTPAPLDGDADLANVECKPLPDAWNKSISTADVLGALLSSFSSDVGVALLCLPRLSPIIARPLMHGKCLCATSSTSRYMADAGAVVVKSGLTFLATTTLIADCTERWHTTTACSMCYTAFFAISTR